MSKELERLRRELREYRLQNRLSYVRLGEQVGLSMYAVRDFVMGLSTPHDTTLHVIKQFLSKLRAA